ncbi:hypothetical protein GCM10022251_53610 [Phytohabitans flavus]|uniref:PknH-like extracellular domain-containing protein n=1 Tax=Phytohabitans flavus TaxID=1076124 RepID=A0A6F8XLY9_9ACTN|nr:hypothetical protein [Phytohabitans flavus]BCB74825.1 hypothetical protein Pflav_012350 [Phytohabitans flavus]
MSDRLAYLALVLCGALLAAGCDAGSPVGSATTGSPPATSATTAPSGTPAAATPTPEASRGPVVDMALLRRRAAAAQIPPGGLVVLGGARKPKLDEADTFGTADVCGRYPAADADRLHASHIRVWAATGLWVRNITHAYGTAKGVDVVQQVRANLGACTKYKSWDGETTLLGEVTLPAYPGLDQRVAYCHRSKPAGQTTYIACDAYLAKGTMISTVRVLSGATRASNADAVVIVAAASAAALVEA